MDYIIQKIVDTIDSDYEILSVPLRAEHYAQFSNCYAGVTEKVRRSGGRVQYGWLVAHTHFLCEAVHHAVWESPDGALLDVTPYHKPTDSILFIPDDRYIYDGVPIDNVRINVSGKLIVDDFIIIAHLVERIRANGIRKDESRLVMSFELGMLHNKYVNYGQSMVSYLGKEINKVPDECFCGSSKPFANCHHIKLWEEIDKDIRGIPDKLIHLQNYF
ncbi:MAG: hypothetical protein J0I41_22960 [Filimonas sp.]|nr:hypothetical protein [Filimonas sp.]